MLVICDGFLFRLRVSYPREPALLRLSKAPERAAQLERTDNMLPKMTSALAALQRQFPAYRWVGGGAGMAVCGVGLVGRMCLVVMSLVSGSGALR